MTRHGSKRFRRRFRMEQCSTSPPARMSMSARRLAGPHPADCRARLSVLLFFPASLVPSNSAIQAALEPVKLYEGIGEGGREVGGRFVVQPIGLD
jgi:hypothetical protein